MKYAIFTLGIMLAAIPAHAQVKPIRVHVDCTTDGSGDEAGQRFCSALRDAIARSHRYHETRQDTTENYQFVIHTESALMISGENGRPIGSGIAVALTLEKRNESKLLKLWENIVSRSPNQGAENQWAIIDSFLTKYTQEQTIN